MRTTADQAATRVAIRGAGGRMGQRLVALTEADPALALAKAFDRAVPISGEALREVEAGVVIDFSSADSLPGTIDAVVAAGAAMVIGTTGLSEADHARLDAAAAEVPVLEASNFSMVVNVLHDLVARAVRLLGEGWDLEIAEAHHRHKKDAPSGTALALARTLAEAAGRDPDCILTQRSGDDVPRQPNDITVQSTRIGDDPGQHTVYLAGLGERLELKHVATNPDSYALGALRAAKWIVGRPARRYTMAEVLGLS
ncbi:MAG: 4-hydroxy-tetrahydrodipicolinate reductase [Planctomycetota bacterium]